MKEPALSPQNIQTGAICGFFAHDSFQTGIILEHTDSSCKVAYGEAQTADFPPGRLVLISSQTYTTDHPFSCITGFAGKVETFRNSLPLSDIRHKMLNCPHPLSLEQFIRTAGLPEDDVTRFAVFLALREKPAWFRIKKGLYHTLTIEQEQAWLEEEQRRELHRLDTAACPWLAKKGLPVLFTPALLEAAELLPAYETCPDRTDLTGVQCWTIDAENSLDLDDAISLQPTQDGWQLGIHITDVSSFISQDSALDREAYRRTTSVYLPELDVHMLPQSISCRKASLLQGSLRPALSIVCEVDSCGEILSQTAFPSQIKVSANYSYEQFEAFLTPVAADNPDMHCVAPVLQQIAEKHLQKRIRAGALVMEDRNITPARGIVAECMVIYNSTLASLARDRQTPLFYRYLEAPDGVLSRANDYPHHVPPSVLGTLPRPHAGMGLPAYAQFSSPLRRYSDLVNQRQILAVLSGVSLPYDREELDNGLEHLSNTRQIIRQVTQQAEDARAVRDS